MARRGLAFVGAICVFFFIFASLRSRHYLAVDGALRATEVYWTPTWFLHGNNHMLYPIWVRLWALIVSKVSITSATAVDFLRVSQLMNALFAAVTLGVTGANIALLSGPSKRLFSLPIALPVLLLAFSNAFLLHATNSAEPMAGLLFNSLALLFCAVSVRTGYIWPVACAGISLALAMGSYQSMVLIGPFLLVFVSFRAGEPLHLRRALLFCSAFVTAVALVFGLAYYATGTTSAGSLLKRFFVLSTGEADVFGGVHLSSLPNFAQGFCMNIVNIMPENFAGWNIYRTAHGLDARIVITWVISVVVFGFFLYFLLSCCMRAYKAMDKDQRSFTIAFVAGLPFLLFPPFYWDPSYDKLWLEPFMLLAVMLGVWLMSSPSGNGGVKIALVIVVAIVISINGLRAVKAHFDATPDLDNANRLSGIVGHDDLLILGWDAVSLYYLAFVNPPNENLLDLPSTAVLMKGATVAYLKNKVAGKLEAHHRVFFLGVLDLSRSAWDAFLGSRCRIPFEAFSELRANSKVLQRYDSASGPRTLREVELVHTQLQP